MDSIRKRLGQHDHNWMTYAAAEALSEEERASLEPELELLITLYCIFPDMNWSLYGEWGGWSGYPENGRSPDTRREWNISRYMECDPVAGTGKRYLHASPDVYAAGRKYFRKSVESFLGSRHRDGVILLGILAHYLEDEATFGHMQALHRGHGFDVSLINTKGYEPKILGRDLDSAVMAIEKRGREITAFVNEKNLRIRQTMKEGNVEEFQQIHLECNNEGARATADMFRTALYLAGKKKTAAKPVACGVNLIRNSSFEDDDGSGFPESWYIRWRNLKDPAGRAFWEKKLNRNTRNSHTGKGAVSIMWPPEEGLEWKQRWPEAIYVKPGERYYLTGWLKTHKATGKSFIALECCDRSNKPVRRFESVSLADTNDWQKLGLEVAIPEGAEKAVALCRSEKNQGIAWFDDMELIRLSPEEPARPQGVIGRDDLALCLSFEEEGYEIKDTSTYGEMNNPIITCSGKDFADLHTKGVRGKGLKFDGQHDFLELPFSRIQDPLAAEEITVSAWIYADRMQNACLLSKETSAGGYRAQLAEDGRITFLLSAGRKAVVEASADYPVKKWFHLACTAKAGERIKVYVDGALSAESSVPVANINAGGADFYIGAERGIENFFRGRVDELLVYDRILDISDISDLMK